MRDRLVGQVAQRLGSADAALAGADNLLAIPPTVERRRLLRADPVMLMLQRQPVHVALVHDGRVSRAVPWGGANRASKWHAKSERMWMGPLLLRVELLKRRVC